MTTLAARISSLPKWRSVFARLDRAFFCPKKVGLFGTKRLTSFDQFPVLTAKLAC